METVFADCVACHVRVELRKDDETRLIPIAGEKGPAPTDRRPDPPPAPPRPLHEGLERAARALVVNANSIRVNIANRPGQQMIDTIYLQGVCDELNRLDQRRETWDQDLK